MHRYGVCICVIVMLSTGILVAQRCNELAGASSDKLVSYLNAAVPASDNTERIAFAILQIGDQRYQPGIPSLVRLLDFRWPTDKVAEIVGGHHSLYPALAALEQIGPAAAPQVLGAIKSDSVSPLGRENAVELWMFFHRTEYAKAVAALKHEANKSVDHAVKQNIASALVTAVRMCPPRSMRACEIASKTGRWK